MENQHKHIRGYRDLNHDEIDLMNELKAEGERIDQVLKKVHSHLLRQEQATTTPEERTRIVNAQPGRWLSMARTDMQTGLMRAVRAVAQPDSF